MMRFATLCLLAATPLFAAPVPKELKNEGKLEGTWKVTELSTNGRDAGQQGTYWTIDPEGMLTLHGQPKVPENHSNITFKYDPRTKAIDYTSVSGSRNYPGIYELRGGTLKLCFELNDQTRPKVVEAGSSLNLWTFTRVRSEEKK